MPRKPQNHAHKATPKALVPRNSAVSPKRPNCESQSAPTPPPTLHARAAQHPTAAQNAKTPIFRARGGCGLAWIFERPRESFCERRQFFGCFVAFFKRGAAQEFAITNPNLAPFLQKPFPQNQAQIRRLSPANLPTFSRFRRPRRATLQAPLTAPPPRWQSPRRG